MGKAREYWDKNLEYNELRKPAHGSGPDTNAGAFLAWMLEAAGDIIRELDKEYADYGYIFEKYNRIKNNIRSRDWRDPLSERENASLVKIKSDIQGIPADSEIIETVKTILLYITDRKTQIIESQLKKLGEQLSQRFPNRSEVVVSTTESEAGEKDTTLRIVCMYCKKVMGYKPGLGVSGDSYSICKECWEKEFPNWPYHEERIDQQPSTHDNMVQHLGYSPDELTEEQKARLVQDSQRRLAGAKSIPDSNLSSPQLASLNLARVIAGIKVNAADLPPASDRVRTAGMYSRSTREIYISPEQLEKGSETVNTVIHELAHHTSGADDGEPEHAAEIGKLANKVVLAAERGEYDRYLTGKFNW